MHHLERFVPSEPPVPIAREEESPAARGVTASPDRLLWLIACAPVAPQIAGSVFNIWYNVRNVEPLLADFAARERFTDTVIAYNLAVYPIAVLVWIRAVLSIRPALRELSWGSSVDAALLDVARRRLINLPWWGAGVAGVGWFLSIPVFLVSLSLLPGALDDRIIWHLPIAFLISAMIATTHSFFLIEVVSHRFLFDRFFRDARAASTPGGRPLGLRGRGLMGACSVGVCPIISLLLLLLAPQEDFRDTQSFAIYVGMISIVFGFFTAWMVSRLVLEPVEHLRRAAKAMAAGDYDVHITLRRADEFGPLIDEFNRMVAELKESRRLRETFGLHVGRRAARQILAQDPGLRGREEDVTVMFVDIRGFTRRCARCSPHEAVAVLNAFLHDMVNLVEGCHGGMVNKFLGDGFMALFGVGGLPPDHAAAAIASGRAMLAQLENLNRRIEADGHAALEIGIGIHTGGAVVGSIGSAQRLEYTAIGDTVNLASRVESLTKEVGEPLLVTEAVVERLEGGAGLKKLPPQRVKGLSEPVRVLALDGGDGGGKGGS